MLEMLNGLKRVIVESFVGTIALGYLFAQAILTFVNIFTAPVAGWVSRRMYQEIAPRTSGTVGLPFQAALPQLVSFVVLLLVWYVLLRWLYFTPPKRNALEPALNREQDA
jgi:hypothetical protein